MTNAQATRIYTDDGTVIVFTKWGDGSYFITIVDDEKSRGIELSLSKRDIDEIADVIHGHEQ